MIKVTVTVSTDFSFSYISNDIERNNTDNNRIFFYIEYQEVHIKIFTSEIYLYICDNKGKT